MDVNCELYVKILEHVYDGVYFIDPDGKIAYWNRGAERLTGYRSTEVVGTRCQDNILMHVDRNGNNLCLTSCPARESILDGKSRELGAFLHHKEGHRVPVLIRVSPVTNANGQIIGAVEIFSDNSKMLDHSDKIDALQKMAMFDSLTELANRRYAEMKLFGMLGEFKNYGRGFGVLFIDVDLFKEINDKYGHIAGDKILKMVSKTMLHRLRVDDILSRWGGDEFLAITASVDTEQLYSIASDLRALVEQSYITYEGHFIYVTVSIGATLAKPDDTMESLFKRVDDLNYKCKATGRNCLSLG